MGEDGKPLLNKDGKPVINFMRFFGVSVFDYRDTDGDPLPERPDTSHVMKNIEGDAMPEPGGSVQGCRGSQRRDHSQCT